MTELSQNSASRPIPTVKMTGPAGPIVVNQTDIKLYLEKGYKLPKNFEADPSVDPTKLPKGVTQKQEEPETGTDEDEDTGEGEGEGENEGEGEGDGEGSGEGSGEEIDETSGAKPQPKKSRSGKRKR